MQIGLFVYGTLMNGSGRPAEIYGELYDLGAFPGAKRVGDANSGIIPGEIIPLADGDLESFDVYEGVDRGLYRRVRTLTTDDEIVWVYEFAQNPVYAKRIKQWERK